MEKKNLDVKKEPIDLIVAHLRIQEEKTLYYYTCVYELTTSEGILFIGIQTYVCDVTQ